MTVPRPLSVLQAPGLGPVSVVLAALAIAALGLGPHDVTSAVWLDAVPGCGASLLPALGREVAMLAPMVGLVLVGHGIGADGARSWKATAVQIGLMALLHLALMLGDGVSRHAGSVALGRDLRAACLASLAAAAWLYRRTCSTASLACAVQCGSAMATLTLAASLPWSIGAVASLAVLIARTVPEAPFRRRWTSASGLAAAIAVAGWG